MEGEGIEQGKSDPAQIVDLAPTILHLFDLPVPDDMDGKVLLSFLKKKKEVKFIPGKGKIKRKAKPTLPVKESELIREKLKGLGYLD
ncbi:MAG: hypothetical protein ABIN58_12000 [candidate division WOR-3 bacterium]